MLDNMKDKTFLLICTVRYCFDKQSYVVQWIRDLLVRHWNEIPRNDRKLILNDIKSYLNNKGSSDLYRIYWDEILQLGYKDKLIIKEK